MKTAQKIVDCLNTKLYNHEANNIFYARFQILAVHLHFGLFWSADIATCTWQNKNDLVR